MGAKYQIIGDTQAPNIASMSMKPKIYIGLLQCNGERDIFECSFDCPEGLGCPKCNETDTNRLLLNERDQVKCLTCGTHYGISGDVTYIIPPEQYVQG